MLRKTELYCWREVRLNVRWKYIKPVFCKFRHSLIVKNGHVGLYGITEDMSRKIMLSGSVRKWQPIHYSPIVWIDLDAREGLEEVTDRLLELGWTFDVYFSGNKGFHFAFKRKATPSDELALKDKLLVSEHFRDLKCFRHFDMGIYHPLHLIRGIGCYHEKTGVKKHLIRRCKGDCIPESDHYEVSFLRGYIYERVDPSNLDSRWEQLRHGLCFHNGPTDTGRYQAIWKLAKDLARLDLNKQQILALAEVYNDGFHNPHGDSEIQRAVEDAIKAIKGEKIRNETPT